MTPFTKEQARDRFPALPSQLQDAVFSSLNAEIIGDLCQKAGLSDDIAEGIASIVTAVLLGFLSPDNMNTEIQALGVDAAVAKSIGFSLNNEIVERVRPALNQINKTAGGPAESAPLPAPVSVDKVMRDIGGATAATPPPANKLAEKGWSHLSANDPIMKVTVTRNAPGSPATNRATPPPAPVPFASITATTPAAPRPQQPSNPMPQPRPPMQQPRSQAPQVPAPPQAPTILQTNPQFTAVPKNTDFHFTKPNAGAQVQIDNIKAVPRVMPAVVEFGGAAPAAPGISPAAPRAPQDRPAVSAPPLASAPVSTDDARHVTEMTAMAFAPAAPAAPATPAAPTPAPSLAPRPPMPAPIPQPSAPPQSQPQPQIQTQQPQKQGKIIFQNFSENDPPPQK